MNQDLMDPTAAEVLALIRDVREIAAWLADACYWTRADKLCEAASLLEQRQSVRDAALEEAAQLCEANPLLCRACGASLPNPNCGHKNNGVIGACVPAVDDLAAAIRAIKRSSPPAPDGAPDMDRLEYRRSLGLPKADDTPAPDGASNSKEKP